MADRRFVGLLEIGAASKELGSGANRGEPERTRLFITPMDSPVDGGDFNLSFRAAETDAARARENRRWLRFVVGRPVSCLHQVHSARVLDLDQVLEGAAFGDGAGLEKVSFHSNPKERQCQKCSNYCTIALISHSSQVMLKILQARLQHYVNRELPDVQVGVRKSRRTRDYIIPLLPSF